MRLLFLGSCQVFLFCLLQIFTCYSAKATHILSGDLTYTTDPDNLLKIKVKLTLYTSFSFTQPDYPKATIGFGDGTAATVDRKSRSIYKQVYFKEIYETEHTYRRPMAFTLTFMEFNRAIDIVNVTNSADESYYITTQGQINPFRINNSVQFLKPPVFDVFTGTTVKHQVGAYDPDGDSLAYSLVPCLRYLNQNTTGYYIPDFISLNANTGEINWHKPMVTGPFIFAVKITEYRNKVPIGYVLRDFVVTIKNSDNDLNQSLTITNQSELPFITANQIFVVPGQAFNIKTLLTDNQADSLRLSAYSDLFGIAEKLNFTKTGLFNTSSAEFTLEPEVALKRSTPYLVIFRGCSFKGSEEFCQETGIQIYVGSRTITGTDNAQDLEVASVYPNPAGNFIVIKIPAIRKDAMLFVYDDAGRLVWHQQLTAKDTVLNRKDFARSGKYIYKVAEGQKIARTGQFIFK